MAEKNHKILEKSLKMLEYVSRNSGATLTEICNAVEIPKGTAHSLLNTFVNMQYMKKDKNSLYRVDVGLFELGTRYADNDNFFQTAREVLAEIVNKVGETAHLAVLNGTDAVYVCKQECTHAVRMISFVGKSLPAHASAIGKALLSGYGDEEIYALYQDKALEQLTPNTVYSTAVLIQQIHEVRQKGYALEHEESTLGVECIAVPITGRHSGIIEAAVSISVPVFRYEGNMEKFLEPLTAAKRSLEVLI